MTAQPTRDQRVMWRQIATDAGDDPYANTLHPDEVLALLDQLDQAEARIKAVRELCDTAPDDEDLDPLSSHYASGYELALQDIRRALEG